MKRSEINALIRDATRRFQQTGWALPPQPQWDVTDFGLGNWREFGLVLVNLAEEPEYCEKLMYAKRGMVTPTHCHRVKKEDIICRHGRLRIRVWSGPPDGTPGSVNLSRNGGVAAYADGSDVHLEAGERLTLKPGVYHEFEPDSDECVIGEVSTANDDAHDNYFVNPDVGRYPEIVEDEPSLMKLISDG